jgi:hypothetical protein
LKREYNDWVTWDSYGNLNADEVREELEKAFGEFLCETDLGPCEDRYNYGSYCDEYGCWTNDYAEPECDEY